MIHIAAATTKPSRETLLSAYHHFTHDNGSPQREHHEAQQETRPCPPSGLIGNQTDDAHHECQRWNKQYEDSSKESGWIASAKTRQTQERRDEIEPRRQGQPEAHHAHSISVLHVVVPDNGGTMGRSLRNVPRAACGAGGCTAGAPHRLSLSHLRNIRTVLHMRQRISPSIGCVNSSGHTEPKLGAMARTVLKDRHSMRSCKLRLRV